MKYYIFRNTTLELFFRDFDVKFSDYSDVLNGRPKGMWMVEWARELQKKNKEPKEPSSFAKWSKQFK